MQRRIQIRISILPDYRLLNHHPAAFALKVDWLGASCELSAMPYIRHPKDDDHRDQPEWVEACSDPKQRDFRCCCTSWAGQQGGGRGIAQGWAGRWRWGDWRGCRRDGCHPNRLGLVPS